MSDAYPLFLGPNETLEKGYIFTRDEQGNIIGIIDAKYSYKVAVAKIQAQEEASWPPIEPEAQG